MSKPKEEPKEKQFKYTREQKFALMGKLVLVSAQYIQTYKNNDDRKFKIAEIEPRAGWVTGFSYIKTGYRVNEGYSIEFFETGRLPVIKVRFWFNLKEINVPYKKLMLTHLVKPYAVRKEVVAESKKFFHEQIECFPRDKKGRFIKTNNYRDKNYGEPNY